MTADEEDSAEDFVCLRVILSLPEVRVSGMKEEVTGEIIAGLNLILLKVLNETLLLLRGLTDDRNAEPRGLCAG